MYLCRSCVSSIRRAVCLYRLRRSVCLRLCTVRCCAVCVCCSSELDATLRKLEDLKKKPDLLKAELRKFVAQLPLEHTVDVKADKTLFDTMMGLVTYELRQPGSPDLPVIMQALQRMLRIRGFYSAIPRCSVVPLIQSLQMRDPKNVLCTLQALALVLDCRCPPDKKFDKSVAELAAKQAFFESQGYDVLVKRVLLPYGRTPHAAVLAKVLDILALDLVDNCITTRFVGIQKLLALLNPHVDLLLSLTTHRDLNTRCYASILLQGYLLHSSLQTTQNLQSKVLEEGHLLHYVLFAIDGANLPANHPYTKHWFDKNLTELSRNLLGLLCAGNPGIVEVATHNMQQRRRHRASCCRSSDFPCSLLLVLCVRSCRCVCRRRFPSLCS